MKLLRTVLVGFAFGLVAALAPSCSGNAKVCNPSSCNGCCDEKDECQPGFVPTACGVGGGACTACAGGQACSGGVCLGSSGGTDGGGGGGSLSQEQSCPAYLDAWCGYLVRCGWVQAQASCLEQLKMFNLDCGDEAAIAAIKDGRASWDGAKARLCVDTFRTTAVCDEFFPTAPPQACDQAMVGKVTDGGCYESQECAGANSCNTQLGCPGTCTPERADGETLVAGQSCLFGLYEYGSSSGTVCKAPVAAGGSCAPLLGSSEHQRCGVGHFCNASAVCEVTKGAGVACSADVECQGSLACVQGTCTALGGLGQACSIPGVFCKLDLYCDATTASDGGVLIGICRAKGATNQSCRKTDQCLGKLECQNVPLDGGTGTCQGVGQVGATCGSNLDCASTNYCLSGTCAAKKGTGATCSLAYECESDQCSGGVCLGTGCFDPTP